MFIIAVCSTHGGVGKTTVTANLATLMTKQAPALAVEWDPSNSLGFHLGLTDPPEQGWIPHAASGMPQYETSHRNSDGVEFLSFGQVPEQQRQCFEQSLLKDHLWLSRNLKNLELPDNTIAFVDTQRAPSVYFDQAVRAADLLLAVMTPNPAFSWQIAAMDALVAYLQESTSSRPELLYLLNQLDTTRSLAHDVLTIMRSKLHHRLLRYTIHRDEAVPESAACNTSLAEYAPDGQAAHDFQGIASWLIAHVSEMSQTGAAL